MTEAIGFDAFMDEALYGEYGFYAKGRGAGRRGADFLTSPEVGPLFGAVIARALDEWWIELGEPKPFVVVEGGAGRGALRDAVLAAATSPLEYIAVEFADTWPDNAHVVVANELLDNLPFKIVERVDGAWVELLVANYRFVRGDVVGFDLDAPEGTRLPLHTRAVEWVTRARATARRVVAFDYGVPKTAELMGREWLRTYREHGRSSDPFVDPGLQDITCDVAFDQLAPDLLTTQADWLGAHGIGELVDEARAAWTERAAVGDLDALKARSRVTEADALVDPVGLGGFLVAEWVP